MHCHTYNECSFASLSYLSIILKRLTQTVLRKIEACQLWIATVCPFQIIHKLIRSRYSLLLIQSMSLASQTQGTKQLKIDAETSFLSAMQVQFQNFFC